MDATYGELARAARALVDPGFIDNLKSPRLRTVILATGLIWGQLVLSWWVALLGPIWLAWLPFLINCAISQAMLLWMHEASHFSLFRDRRQNDIWCDVFFAGPIGVSVAAYRARHMTHHAHLGTPDDKDGYPYQFAIKGFRPLMGVMFRALSGALGLWLAVDKYLGTGKQTTGVPTVAPRWLAPAATLAFNLTLLGLCVWSGRWYLYFLLWVYPIIAVAIALNVVRTVAEHQPEDFPSFTEGAEVAMRPVARTTVPSPLEKWLMYQANFNYHVEHHLFPAVPQHNLRLLHVHLVERGFYRQFPDALQRSGLTKFWQLARNRTQDDFSDALNDAVHT